MPIMRRTHYEVLGLGPNDTKAYLIKHKFNTYKQLLDDQYLEDAISLQDYEEKVEEITEAFDTLINPELRENYRNKILLEAALENMGFPSALINLAMSGQDAVNKVSAGEEGTFLIRKSENSNTIVFTARTKHPEPKKGEPDMRVSHKRVEYKIENGSVKFDPQYVINFYRDQVNQQAETPAFHHGKS